MKKTERLLRESTKEITFSSGVTVMVLPFPGDLWPDLLMKANKDFPDHDPPMKTIDVFDGTEEIEDLEDPEYLAKQTEAENGRNNLIGEAMVDLCIEIDMKKHKREVKRLAKYSDLPKDLEELRLFFLSHYVIRSSADYKSLFLLGKTLSNVGNEEVTDLRKFPGDDVEGSKAPGDETPGVEEGAVEIQSEAV